MNEPRLIPHGMDGNMISHTVEGIHVETPADVLAHLLALMDRQGLTSQAAMSLRGGDGVKAFEMVVDGSRGWCAYVDYDDREMTLMAFRDGEWVLA